MQSEESNGVGSGFPGWILVVLGVLVGTYAIIGILTQRSLRRATTAELRLLLTRWVEAGKPTETPLKAFMSGRGAEFVVSNRNITLGDSNFVTQFATVRPKSGEEATVFITTNGICIWWPKVGKPKIVN